MDILTITVGFLASLAGILFALMGIFENNQHHKISIFNNLIGFWGSKEQSSSRKYKEDGVTSIFWGATHIFSFLTDAWHAASTGMLLIFGLISFTIASYAEVISSSSDAILLFLTTVISFMYYFNWSYHVIFANSKGMDLKSLGAMSLAIAAFGIIGSTWKLDYTYFVILSISVIGLYTILSLGEMTIRYIKLMLNYNNTEFRIKHKSTGIWRQGDRIYYIGVIKNRLISIKEDENNDTILICKKELQDGVYKAIVDVAIGYLHYKEFKTIIKEYGYEFE